MSKKLVFLLEVNIMSDMFSIPLQVFGLGFVISMCMAVLIKLLMDAIKHFNKNTDKAQE